MFVTFWPYDSPNGDLLLPLLKKDLVGYGDRHCSVSTKSNIFDNRARQQFDERKPLDASELPNFEFMFPGIGVHDHE
jgi:hypothetical protein